VVNDGGSVVADFDGDEGAGIIRWRTLFTSFQEANEVGWEWDDLRKGRHWLNPFGRPRGVHAEALGGVVSAIAIVPKLHQRWP